MQFYKAGGQLYGTQADARRVDKKFEPVDVPTDKAGLMAYINALLQAASPHGFGVRDDSFLGNSAAGDASPAEATYGGVRFTVLEGPSAPALPEQIMAAEGAAFAQATEALIERVGEIGTGDLQRYIAASRRKLSAAFNRGAMLLGEMVLMS